MAESRSTTDQLHSNPLIDHSLCPSCGWIGQLEGTGNGPSSVGGTVAAVGGTVAVVGGSAGMVIGIILVLIGLPLLLLGGIGIIPIILGGIIIAVSGTATSAGVAIGTAGVKSASNASRQRKIMATAPIQCPACRNIGIVPAVSPVAQKLIQENSHIASLAQEIVIKEAAKIEARAALPILQTGYSPCPKCGTATSDQSVKCWNCDARIREI